jgi:hypothetical protein
MRVEARLRAFAAVARQRSFSRAAEALLANARRALASGADAETGTLSLAASGIRGT